MWRGVNLRRQELGVARASRLADERGAPADPERPAFAGRGLDHAAAGQHGGDGDIGRKQQSACRHLRGQPLLRLVRYRANHAGVHSRAGAVAGTLRPGGSLVAGRMRDRDSADRPAPAWAGRDGRGHRREQRLYPGAGQAPERDSFGLGSDHGDRDREPDDGRDAGRGHDRDRECRPRTGS